MTELLCLKKLSVWFSDQEQREFPALEEAVVKEVDLAIETGETVALVGESGSGKTVTALTILRLLETIGQIRHRGEILFQGRDILGLEDKSLRNLRGNDIAMIFQEPMTSLNPVFTVGNQIMEPLILHRGMSRREAHRQAITLLHKTGIHEPENKILSYPHQLSGGQRQRMMIAMAIACQPKLLIADEPTTALDVTVQAQILALLQTIQAESGMAILLITHNLPIVKEIADSIHIMHQGK
ncbi:unnamed protein product, partial [Cyprideis torosa]